MDPLLALRESARAKLLMSHADMNGHPITNESNIYFWIVSEITPYVNKVTDGRTHIGATVYGGGSQLVFKDAAAYLEMDITFSTKLIPRNLEIVDEWLTVIPHTVVRSVKTRQNRTKLDLVATVDLDKWPALARNLLWINLQKALVDMRAGSDMKIEAKQNARVLINRLCPELTLDYFAIAADLGLLQTAAYDFGVWLTQRQPEVTVVPANAPDDIL